jgi:L-alanine-DL-glutamate epimerase-like enolase superfamily enzyme
VSPAAGAARLGRALADLALEIEAVTARVAEVDLPSYPDGPRPTSTVALLGRGHEGRGENVGWTDGAHATFVASLEAAVPRGRLTLGTLSTALRSSLPEPYDRAAVEAAAIDLALLQSETTLAELAGATPEPVRYVVSLGRSVDPLPELLHERRVRADTELKLDVDPGWSDATIEALGRQGGIAVLDWKGSGETADHERLHRALPGALHEDPACDAGPGGGAWSASLRRRLSFDQRLTSVASLDLLPSLPAAVNVKPARMGGVLEAVATIARASERGIGVYLGGMFEVGIGRTQLLALAALLCPEGPNDIAPIPHTGARPLRPARLVLEPPRPGFG